MPALHVTHQDASDVLMDNEGNGPISVKKIQGLVAANHEIYMTRADLLAAEARFANWFKSMKKGKMVTFILSVIGEMTGGVTLYLLYKYTNMSAMVTSMWLTMGQAKAETMNGQGATIALPPLIINALTQAVILIFILVILRAVCKNIRKSRWTRRFLQRNGDKRSDGSRSDILIEFSDGEDTHLQYLVSVAIHGSLVSDMPYNRDVYPQIVAHERNWINDILTINWKYLDVITLTDCDVLHLPEKMSVALSDKRKIRRILRHPYTIRVIITSDKLVWQMSHNGIESRRQQWAETRKVEGERKLLSKTGEIAPAVREDMIHREELVDRWATLGRTDGNGYRSPPRDKKSREISRELRENEQISV
jgi:hypothetical protein